MSGLESLDPRYALLYQRARAVLEADPRVASVRLGGSVADGTADRWSDLDLMILAAPGRAPDLLADWPDWVEAISPTVFARTPIAPSIINAVTADGLTFDLVVHQDTPRPYQPPPGIVVGGLSGQRFSEVDEALEYALAEQLRGLVGPFISLLQREEHLRHLTGVPHLLGLLTTVFLAEEGAEPPGKRWNRTFTTEQRAAVAALPPVSATRDGLMAFGLALAELVVTRARPLFDERGLTWPTALARVVSERLRDQLGVEAGTWLY